MSTSVATDHDPQAVVYFPAPPRREKVRDVAPSAPAEEVPYFWGSCRRERRLSGDDGRHMPTAADTSDDPEDLDELAELDGADDIGDVDDWDDLDDTDTEELSALDGADPYDDLIPPDPRPYRAPDTREYRRAVGKRKHHRCNSIRRMSIPWHGPIPNVGQSVRTWHNPTGAWEYTPVAVDVVPVIHDRGRRGEQAARFAAGVAYVRCGKDARSAHWTIVRYRPGDDDGAASLRVPLPASRVRPVNGRGQDDGGSIVRRLLRVTYARRTTAPPRLPP